MDMQKTAREIGLFETGVNLSKVCASTDVIQKVGASMPLPDEDIAEQIPRIAAWLHSLGKSKYMFLTPEIALIEELVKLSGEAEVIIAIPSDLDEDVKERIGNNLPHGARVTLWHEPFFLPLFPKTGLIAVCGYAAGGRPMVLDDTYRMVEHYSSFLGKKVFIPYKEILSADRYDGWREVSKQKLNTEWRRDDE